MTDGLKQTPLNDEHVALGGKMVPFAGYSMPVQYPTGITTEHRAVREACGLFDVSHMGEFIVRGPDALALVQRISVNDAATIEVGQAQYSAMCLETGCVIDDVCYSLGASPPTPPRLARSAIVHDDLENAMRTLPSLPRECDNRPFAGAACWRKPT